MNRHVNIPIFIPHLGCPNKCVFCNQRTISGKKDFDISSVRKTIEDSLLSIEDTAVVEIAFFGGSFTGIDRNLMVSLLSIAHEYIVLGKVNSIRCSTRPDYIDDEILNILFEYGVRVIELGLQSFDDGVLRLSKRGHDQKSEIEACTKIINRGFTLVGQMMIGLPGSTLEKELGTARFIADIGATYARIYPTVVFYDTELCEMANSGEYTPLADEEALERSTRVFEYLYSRGVKVIRIGLCASDNLVSRDTYHSGPNHPAFGDLVIGEYYYRRVMKLISEDHIDVGNGTVLRLTVARGLKSCMIGQHKRNKIRLKKQFGFKDIVVEENDAVSKFEVDIKTERV